MAPRLIQRLRKIVDFKAPPELKRQLRELEQGFADAIAGLADGVSALFTGLDGIDIIGSVIRSSRDVKVYTAGGNNLGGAKRADIIRFELTAHATVTGFLAPGVNDTHRKLVVNASAYTVTFTHDATSTAANRIYCPHLVAFTLRPGECTWIDYDRTSQRHRLADQAAPFHTVRTLADLPAPSAGVITLPAGAYGFAATVNGGTNRLDALDGALVFSIAGGGYTTNSSSPAIRVRNVKNTIGFNVENTGSGASWEPFSLSPQFFQNWSTTGEVLCNSPISTMNGCSFEELQLPPGIGSALIQNSRGRIRATGSGAMGEITATGLYYDGSAGPLIEIEDGISLGSGAKIGLIGCKSPNSKLMVLGANINDGSEEPHVSVIGCACATSGSITVDVVPAGGLYIAGCDLHSTPFSGFTRLTANVVVGQGNWTGAGTLIEPTPNGHIVKNNAGTEQTQRYYLKAGTGLEATDDGTNSVLSCTVTSPGVGADRTVYSSNGVTASWDSTPDVDALTAHESITLRFDDDPGDPPDGVSFFYDSTALKLIAAFDNSFRWDIIPDQPFVSGQKAKHFHERYVFDRISDPAAYAFITEGYTSPFGLTHGTSNPVIVEGEVRICVIADGTSGGGRRLPFVLRWTSSSVLERGWHPETYGSGSGGNNASLWDAYFTITEATGTAAAFNVTPSTDATIQVTIEGDVFVAPLP